MQLNTHRFPFLAGILGPLMFAIATIGVGSLRSDYSHLNQFISELGETGGVGAGLMNWIGFIPAAILILAFTVTAFWRLPRTAGRIVGTVFLSLFATGMLLVGLFSCDAGCPTENQSGEQIMHDIASIVAFPAFTLGVTVWGTSLYRTPGWRSFGIYSLASSAVSIVVFVAMIQSEAERNGTGLYQRLFLGTLFVWLAIWAILLWRSDTSADTSAAQMKPGTAQ